MTERGILSLFVFPELLMLFGILWIDLQYKTNWPKKQEDKTAQAPMWVSALLIFLSLGVSLIFNYLMYVWYYAHYPSENMNTVFVLNPLVVVITMAFVILNIQSNSH